MKNFFLLLVSFSFSATLFAQKYMDEIANNSCDCVAKLDKNLSGDEKDMKFGICVIEASMPFQKEIKKDYKIDLNFIDEKVGNELGKLIGVKMALNCPEVFLDSTLDQVDTTSSESIKGEVLKVDEDFFVSISIKDQTSKISKFYWLDELKSNFNLMFNYK